MADVKLTSGITGTITAPGGTDAIPITDNSGAAVLKKITWTSLTAKVIPHSTVTAKGDLIVATGSAAVDNLAAGSDFFAPVYHSGETTGMFTKAVPINLFSNGETVTIANTTTETDLFNFSLPANYLSLKNYIDFGFSGIMSQTTGGDQTITYKLYYGADSFTVVPTISTGTSLMYNWRWILRCGGSTSAQTTLYQYIGTPSSGAGSVGGWYDESLATDATTAQTLRFSIKLSTASASFSYYIESRYVTLYGTTE